ncbi:tRNA (adenosine(37)-N6)-dimethylallyltransferase MiaA [Elizabethkingia meningoseptica]|uniref:tRNA (adenosine(37)-N6)-dimethylallyltransferase MiaA n=1 Tax=Elizabethkingia meningoseptica TaxID=238 RepID=UPI0022F1AE9D|nr:tRNA (adenosine(37)-N6)-dimethylallyltransferase MiaA [Elizabethkingia meningoseptica]EJK5329216.1 tRNA (adenosine(37)-N6)-dimethylallyltransferase MiaA [Elizabethkingia meningoseptica]MDE5468896.1 tRNA (adenosine(37)-N6)-dimethylallyltransferase MiaA [Elizabethkingia meningoseptica]MDE5476209.1 tRNA (adenosine(37)-N6)-dimethylallyltransferase MiaA [Elizabethkingia meningoseptica]MDE5479144.1 tRNA (adenosine(37)-N6)-dimethylallyltransferase MiaA [Elizabethkingia meningoseptica]MDE5485092.1 
MRMKQKNKLLISIIGPTGIGKTKLAIEIAQYLGTEIISCDARQFFKEMPVGTAMPDAEELSAAPHHFIANLSIQDEYSIGKYEKDALAKLEELFQKYDTVVMVGGSGMYERAVIDGLDKLPEANPENIQKLEELLQTEGIAKLQNLLQEADPLYFEKADIENPRRLVRALDIYWQTGKPYSEFLNQGKLKRDFSVMRIGIEAPREVLYERINKRVDIMMEKGLLEEAKALFPFREKTALQTVGYTELFKYMDGEWTLDFAVEEIKKNSRRYAKRQLTWYRKAEDIQYLQLGYSEEDLNKLFDQLSH